MKTPATVALKDANDGSDRPAQLLWWAIVGSGIALRVGVYLFKRSLWLDEAMLATNLLKRSYLELFHRLGYVQVAPPLFLLISKFIYELWGHLEYSLRLLPLLSSCLTLFILGRLLLRLAPGFSCLCALSLYAFGFLNVDYATNFKQYASDQAAAVLLLWAAVRWIDLSNRRKCILAGVLPGLMWLSYTSAFVILGLCVVVCVSTIRGGERRKWAALVVLLVSTALFAGSLYFLVVQHSIGHETQVENFAEGFPERPYLGWFFGNLAALFGSSTALQYGPLLALMLAVWGATSLAHSRYFSVSLLAAGTLLAAFCASYFGGYPFLGGRLGIYWAPIALVLLASVFWLFTVRLTAKARSGS